MVLNNEFFLTKDEHKVYTRHFKHKYLNALAKLAAAEGIELLSSRVSVQYVSAEIMLLVNVSPDQQSASLASML